MAMIDTEQFSGSPTAGLLQGLQVGGNFGLAMRQQKLAEQQAIEQKKAKEKEQAVKMATDFYELASKAQSATVKGQYTKMGNDLLAPYIPSFQGVQVDAADPTLTDFLSRGSKFRKLAETQHPDIVIKDINSYIDELGEKHAKAQVDEKQYKDAMLGATEAKKGIASDLGTLATYPNQFEGQPEYSTPEAKTGILGYQQLLASQMNQYDQGQADKIRDDIAAKKRLETESDFKVTNIVRGDDGKMYGISQAKGKSPELIPIKGSEGKEFVDKSYKPLPDKIMDTFTDTQTLLHNLDVMAANNHKSGIVKGWGSKALAYTGNDDGASNFVASYNQARLSGQSLVKGIPSDKDTQIVNATLSKLTNDPKMNEALIRTAKNAALRSYRNRIKANKKFYHIPPDLENTLTQYSSDVATLDEPVGKSATVGVGEGKTSGRHKIERVD